MSIGNGLTRAGLTVLAALALAACDGGGNITAEETVTQSFTTGQAPRIVVETFNGSIDVGGGATGGVEISVVKRGAGFSQAEAEADLQNVEVSISQVGDTIRVEARRTDSPFVIGNSGAAVRVSAPAGAALTLRTSNGAIRTQAMSGSVDADTSNGAVDVLGGSGPISVSTSNGAIDIEAGQAAVDARTSNGRITFRGSLTDDSHAFRTSNGRIELALPAGSRFRIDASTSNGRVSCDFPVTQAGSQDENELRGAVGDNPAMSITASSSNGNIDIRQGE